MQKAAPQDQIDQRPRQCRKQFLPVAKAGRRDLKICKPQRQSPHLSAAGQHHDNVRSSCTAIAQRIGSTEPLRSSAARTIANIKKPGRSSIAGTGQNLKRAGQRLLHSLPFPQPFRQC